MIDWLTLRLDLSDYPHVLEGLSAYKMQAGRIICISGDGEMVWEKLERAVIRSDSHQVVFEVGYNVCIHGSPARVNSAHNVFGSDDIRECALNMIRFVCLHASVVLPHDLTCWKVTRVDITENYDLGSEIEVKQALSYLRQSGTGRMTVRTTADTVYWGSTSKLRSGKAYAKGAHLAYQIKKRQSLASGEEQELARRLLRLELSLKGQWWRERSGKPWYEFTQLDMSQLHQDFFSQVIGKIEVIEMDTLLQEFEKAAQMLGLSKGRALAAYRTWQLIKAIGIEQTKASMPYQTYYNHQRIMFASGFTHADFVAGTVVQFRRRTIELGQPVKSWDDMKKKEAA